jgi:hypothetical protein
MRLNKFVKSSIGGLCGAVLAVSAFAADVPVDLELAIGVDVQAALMRTRLVCSEMAKSKPFATDAEVASP